MQVDPSDLTEPDGSALCGIKAALAVRPAALPAQSCNPCIMIVTLDAQRKHAHILAVSALQCLRPIDIINFVERSSSFLMR